MTPEESERRLDAIRRQRQEEIVQQRAREVELELIRGIEVIEGRVPTRAEVARYGLARQWPDGRREWWWKDVLVVVEAGTMDGCLKDKPRFDLAQRA